MSAAGSAAHQEIAYDRRRLRQWLDGEARADGVTRRRLLTLLAATAAGTALSARNPARAGSSIVKPLPPEWFIQRGTNAETRWEALRGTGHHTPNALFFVRNHTATPVLDTADWRLRLWGDGLRGTPAEDKPVEFGYDDLRALPAVTRTAFVECAGNGRSYYTTQQGETVTGTAWTLGAVGVARW
ncbi:molybdopterin-dependent oxidoreductase, partial [Streptomyces sp. NPDC005921]